LHHRSTFAIKCLAAAAGLVATQAARAADGPVQRPNIVFIIADDLGYGDVSCYGEQDLPTPFIDSIAQAGVRFTAGYMACPVSSPSRAAMLTGRTPTRWGQEFNPEPRVKHVPKNFGLPLSERTFADELKLAGYSTALIGKWHQGVRPELHPQRRGFDEFFGFLHGSHSYYKSEDEPENPILRGTNPVHEDAYLTTAFTREAVDYINRHQTQPFCLVLSYNAPHVPNEPPPHKYMDRFPNAENPTRRIVAAMISAMDDGIGTVLNTLRQERLEDNTLVIFVSDNGGAFSRNHPFAGGKGNLLEGGIRVPFMLQWKGHIQAGQVLSEPVIGTDLYSTILAAAGATPPKDRQIDGVDLLPLCLGKATTPLHPYLAWRYGEQFALRQGDYKLVQTKKIKKRLVDLQTDVTEEFDLSPKLPQVVAREKETYAQWDTRNSPPAPRHRGAGCRRLQRRRPQALAPNPILGHRRHLARPGRRIPRLRRLHRATNREGLAPVAQLQRLYFPL
jgi:arylsulfatase A-like enzyme